MTNKLTTITKDQLDALRSEFSAMPKKTQIEFSAREAVMELAPHIRRMVEVNGYSFADVAATLRESGITLNPSTIRSYLRSIDAAMAKTPAPVRKAKLQPKTTPSFASKPTQTAEHLPLPIMTRDDQNEDSSGGLHVTPDRHNG